MTTEVQPVNHSTEIDFFPRAQPVRASAVATLRAHAQAMSDAKQLADALAQTDMVPADYRGKPGNAAAAILYGAELGLEPIQSLQQIFVVHGRPAIYARTAVALLKREGVVIQTVVTSDESVTVEGRDTRTGQVEEATWTIERAEKAGYTKNAKYKSNPQEMLYAKAAMEVARKLAPDILLGMPYSREELEIEQPVRVESRRVGGGVAAVRERLMAQITVKPREADAMTPGVAEAVADSNAMSAATRKKWLNRMFALLADGDCNERDDQLIVIATVSGNADLHRRDDIDDDQLRAVVEQLNAWSKAGELGTQITEILNTATIAAEDAREA